MDRPLRIAIISDLHCTDDENRRKVTYLHPDTPGRPVMRHPVEALKQLIKDESIKVDILLCPGDITDQVNRNGFFAGWRFLEEIGAALGVNESIYATLGNHDVASRLEKPEAAFSLAKELKVNYPLPTSLQQTEYWGEKFCIIEDDNFRLFIFNSVHDHFNSTTSKKISIDDLTLERINERLKKTNKDKIGIAMSHHHPISHANTDYSDTDIIDKGDKLLKILKDNAFSFYIHGHKHEPMLRNLNDLNILGAASFSCLENLKETESENMFHIVEIQGSKGIIESWEYGPKSGWHKKNSNSSFPNLAGYGYSGTIDDLAKRIDQWLKIKDVENSNLKILKKDIDDIDHLRPDQQKELERKLKDDFSIEIMPSISFGEKASINKLLV